MMKEVLDNAVPPGVGGEGVIRGGGDSSLRFTPNRQNIHDLTSPGK